MQKHPRLLSDEQHGDMGTSSGFSGTHIRAKERNMRAGESASEQGARASGRASGDSHLVPSDEVFGTAGAGMKIDKIDPAPRKWHGTPFHLLLSYRVVT